MRGELFGDPYAVVYFAPASTSQIAPGNGRELANRPAYRQDHWSAQLVLQGGFGTAARFEAWGAWHDWRERFLDFERAVQDPTPTDQQPLRDNGAVAVVPGGLGRDDLFVNARWSAGALAFGRAPGRLDWSLRLYARQGFPIPYFEVASTGDPTAGDKSVLVAPRLDSYRLPTLALVDVSLGRGFALGGGTLTATIDVFNLFNASTTLQVARDVELGVFNRPREIVRPRLARFGLAYRF